MDASLIPAHLTIHCALDSNANAFDPVTTCTVREPPDLFALQHLNTNGFSKANAAAISTTHHLDRRINGLMDQRINESLVASKRMARQRLYEMGRTNWCARVMHGAGRLYGLTSTYKRQNGSFLEADLNSSLFINDLISSRPMSD